MSDDVRDRRNNNDRRKVDRRAPAESRATPHYYHQSSVDDRQLHSLLDVGRALSAEQESSKILDLILEKALENTNADAASIYLIEKVDNRIFVAGRQQYEHKLRFYKSISRTQKTVFSDRLIDINGESIAGYVASQGEIIRVRDCYVIPNEMPFKFNPRFDKETGYRTKSMLTVPMKTNKGKVIGVVQLINKIRPHRRKSDAEGNFPSQHENGKPFEKEIIAFSEHDCKLVATFASHGAIALENSKLTRDIEKLFESFVKASVGAIEARDPSTSGHSDRVAILTVEFAKLMDSIQIGAYRNIKFNPEQLQELRYAALLHDFGKIGVRENVLLKARKLYPHELETVLLRLETLKAKKESQLWRECCEHLYNAIDILRKDEHKKPLHICDGACAHAQNILNNPQEVMSRALWNIDQFTRKIENLRAGIMQANETQIMAKDFDIDTLITNIKQISQSMGQEVLNEHEARTLSIRKGSLGEDEREQIEQHVSFTFDFLKQIAWTDDLAEVANIAHAHHEKLDGSGYPLGLKGDDIPIQSKMMTVSDIYDALTAMDRPYKKAATTERALDILNIEAGEGKLDKDLVKIFIEAKLFLHTANYKKDKKAA